MHFAQNIRFSIRVERSLAVLLSSEKLPRVNGLCYILVSYPSKILQCLIIKRFLSWDLEKQEGVSAVDATEIQLAECRCVWWLPVGQTGKWIARPVTCVSTAFHHHLDFRSSTALRPWEGNQISQADLQISYGNYVADTRTSRPPSQPLTRFELKPCKRHLSFIDRQMLWRKELRFYSTSQVQTEVKTSTLFLGICFLSGF